MGGWYWIGVAAGMGVAIGMLLVGLLAGVRIAVGIALAGAVAGGLLVGLAVGGWAEAAGGIAGGTLGTLGAAQVVTGTLRRGGTWFGTAAIFVLGAVALAALAWIPVVGYLEATLVPAYATRLRRREPERYAGLRTLARD